MTLETLIVIVGFLFLVPLAASAILWRKLNRRGLFLVVSFLSMTAIADISLSLFSDWLIPASPNPLPADLLTFNIQSGHQTHVAMLLTDVVVLVIGVPLLAWLFAALRRVPSSVAAS